MDEDFTKKSTCLLCDAKVDPKSEVQICSTCAIVAMSDVCFDFCCSNWKLSSRNFHVYKAVFASTKKIKFNGADFMIKNFGIDKDGFPFINVEGTPGGTIPQMENTGYAYIFVTNNGTFAVSSDWMYPQWHTHEITLDENDCVKSMKMNSGGTEVKDVIRLIETNATNVKKVMTAEFALGESDGSICATKIFDSAS